MVNERMVQLSEVAAKIVGLTRPALREALRALGYHTDPSTEEAAPPGAARVETAARGASPSAGSSGGVLDQEVPF